MNVAERREWTRARLRYRPVFAMHNYRVPSVQWTVDYPRSDRHLLQGMSASRSRQLRRPDSLPNFQANMIKKLLPYG